MIIIFVLNRYILIKVILCDNNDMFSQLLATMIDEAFNTL